MTPTLRNVVRLYERHMLRERHMPHSRHKFVRAAADNFAFAYLTQADVHQTISCMLRFPHVATQDIVMMALLLQGTHSATILDTLLLHGQFQEKHSRWLLMAQCCEGYNSSWALEWMISRNVPVDIMFARSVLSKSIWEWFSNAWKMSGQGYDDMFEREGKMMVADIEYNEFTETWMIDNIPDVSNAWLVA